ncbi:MAG: uracil-DNA glycosylase [Gemmatimonas sp.]
MAEPPNPHGGKPDIDPLVALLAWQVDAGAIDAIGDAPVNRLERPQPAAPMTPIAAPPATAPAARTIDRDAPAPGTAVGRSPVAPRAAPVAAPVRPPEDRTAAQLAEAATTFEELRAALAAFDGCALKKTATNLVFCDGNPNARLMVIGEAPGADEDRMGKPFVGVSGQLLDRMLAAIGQDRTNSLITNILFWRPPGNRTPTPAEIAACLPFVERMVEIVDPAVLVLAGGIAAKTMLARSEGIMRLRGRWLEFRTPRMARPVPTIATFHPAYLLRSPGQKRLAWQDFLAIRRKLAEA